jgi:hypothetical protein
MAAQGSSLDSPVPSVPILGSMGKVDSDVAFFMATIEFVEKAER